MNITGSFPAESMGNWNPEGSFTHTETSDGFKGANWTSGVYKRFTFNASRTWTGETSAVGGGASHTHGIKKLMININYKYGFKKSIASF